MTKNDGRDVKGGKRKHSYKPRNSTKTMQRILKTAIKEFSRHGFNGARMEKIAKSADTNMRMLYYYFGNKEKLYVAVLEHMYERVLAAEQKLDLAHLEPAEGIRTLVDFTFRHFAEHPDLVNLVMGENMLRAEYVKQSELVASLARPLQASLRELLTRAEKTGAFRPGVDPMQLWITIFSLCWVHLSNRHTLSWMFQTDLGDRTWLDRRREHVKDIVVEYLTV